MLQPCPFWAKSKHSLYDVMGAVEEGVVCVFIFNLLTI